MGVGRVTTKRETETRPMATLITLSALAVVFMMATNHLLERIAYRHEYWA
jgi:hypothetical protein